MKNTKCSKVRQVVIGTSQLRFKEWIKVRLVIEREACQGQALRRKETRLLIEVVQDLDRCY